MLPIKVSIVKFASAFDLEKSIWVEYVKKLY